MDSGKTAALMPKATRNTAKMVFRSPSGTSAIRVASCARLRVPAAEYVRPMPSRKTIDDTIDTTV